MFKNVQLGSTVVGSRQMKHEVCYFSTKPSTSEHEGLRVSVRWRCWIVLLHQAGKERSPVCVLVAAELNHSGWEGAPLPVWYWSITVTKSINLQRPYILIRPLAWNLGFNRRETVVVNIRSVLSGWKTFPSECAWEHGSGSEVSPSARFNNDPRVRVQLESERWGGNGPVDAGEGAGLGKGWGEGRRERRREGRKERRREGAALHSPHGSTSSGLAPLSQSYYDSQTRCKP